MEFRTKTEITPLGNPVGYEHSGLSIGSCFAENIAKKLKGAKFSIASNPFGILYNPASVADCLERLAQNRLFPETELIKNGDLWCSLSAHGSFSSSDADKTLSELNKSLLESSEALKKADYVIITFGTAWIYELSYGFSGICADGSTYTPQERQVAANCHKFPSESFIRRRMGIDEIVSRYRLLLNGILADKQVILTVSPIRHLKDGLHGNNLSKATLLLAAETLTSEFSNVYYFPSFEIVNDELRDYRFYAEDMAHPSQTAINYIWECFRENILSKESRLVITEMEKITAAVNHRPFNPNTEAHKKFLRSAYEKAVELQKRHPSACLGDDIIYFKNSLE